MERISQYQTCDCVVPMRSAKDFWLPARSHARRRASEDMALEYPDLGKSQPKNLWATRNLKIGKFQPVDDQGKQAFARRLQERMDEIPIGQSELQRALGYKSGNSVVHNWLEGHMPRADRLDQLAEILGVNLKWLHYGKGPKLLADAEEIDEAKIAAVIQKLTPDRRKFLMRLAKKMAA